MVEPYSDTRIFYEARRSLGGSELGTTDRAAREGQRVGWRGARSVPRGLRRPARPARGNAPSAMDRGLARIANELSILESVPPPRRGADIDFSTRPADPSRAWTPGQGRRAITVPTASLPLANKGAPSASVAGSSASARNRARLPSSNGGTVPNSSLSIDGANFSGLEIGGTAVHARPSSCTCSGPGVLATGARAPAGSRGRRNFHLTAPSQPPSTTAAPSPGGALGSPGATTLPKPTGMERARVWSELVEDAYRLQEAGYRDEAELIACGQPAAERWSAPPRPAAAAAPSSPHPRNARGAGRPADSSRSCARGRACRPASLRASCTSGRCASVLTATFTRSSSSPAREAGRGCRRGEGAGRRRPADGHAVPGRRRRVPAASAALTVGVAGTIATPWQKASDRASDPDTRRSLPGLASGHVGDSSIVSRDAACTQSHSAWSQRASVADAVSLSRLYGALQYGARSLGHNTPTVLIIERYTVRPTVRLSPLGSRARGRRRRRCPRPSHRGD